MRPPHPPAVNEPRRPGPQPGQAFRIKNAACPRLQCGGDLYFHPVTQAVTCPTCDHRRAVARARARILLAALALGVADEGRAA